MSRRGTGNGAVLLLAAALAFAPALAGAQAPELQARIEPGEIALGDSAELAITVPGGAEAPRVPHVDGLEIESAGRATQIQIVNGRVSRSTSFRFALRPLRAGSFQLPALEIVSDSGDSLSTGPLALRVVPSSGSAQATAPPASGTTSAGEPEPAAARGVARFEIVGPDTDLFVGQLVPVELRMLVPEGVELTEVAPPSLSGAGFTISALADEHPQESRTQIDGVPTTVLTWRAAVSAVKPGTQTLDAKIEGVVLTRAPARARSARPSLFGDDFFGGSLLERVFGGLRQQRIQLSSTPLQLGVQPLPEAGRPADFDGAVGSFRFSTRASPTQAAAGDPVTLSLQVEGRGNFDRVRVGGLANSAGFKTYTPTARFEGEDATGVEGRKVFEQTIIPERGAPELIPPQRFSYFDPEERAYVTLTSDAVPLEISGADPEAGQTSAREAATTPGDTDALALRADLGSLRHGSTPLFLRPAFLAACALPLLTLAGVGVATWRRRRRVDPARARKRETDRVVQQSLRSMDDAIAAADPAAFYAAARCALQARLALRFGANPAALTAADAQIGLSGAPVLAASVRRILEDADAFAYAGRKPQSAALNVSRGHVLDVLAQLEALA